MPRLEESLQRLRVRLFRNALQSLGQIMAFAEKKTAHRQARRGHVVIGKHGTL